MPRDGGGNYSLPPGTTAVSQSIISSDAWNAAFDDIAAMLDAPTPISKGGTNATSVSSAQSALGVIPVSSLSDDTAGRLLKVGSFGVGSNGLALSGNDTELAAGSGFFLTDDTTLNAEWAPAFGAFVRAQRSADRAFELGAATANTLASSKRLWYRAETPEGFSDWMHIPILIETGSNSNGTYRKYSDGTIICTHTVTFNIGIASGYFGGFRCGTQTWTFPTAFDSAPEYFDVQVAAASAFGAVKIGTPTATLATFAVTSIVSSSAADRTVSLFAYGS